MLRLAEAACRIIIIDKKVIHLMEKISPILTFNSQASFLSILFTVEHYYKYFYSDYINIFSKRISLPGFVTERWYCDDMFFDMLMLICSKDFVIPDCFGSIIGMNREILQDNDCIKRIKLMLSMGFYVSGKINEFYVPQRAAEGKYPYRHDFCSSSYDDIRDAFI